MMNDTSGPMFETPLMRFDQDTQSWRTSEATSLWDLPMSSPTLPASGSMRSGELYARPMLERPTSATGSSSLPTPTARDYKDTTVRMEPHRPNDTDTINRALAHLMPTPTVMDMGNNKTPEEWTAWKDEQRAKHNNGNGHGESLTQAAIAWGKYEPAIRRWENLTREVPEPTVPHKDKRRLNPVFVEWMMGLPEGHVTGHGLTPAKELKMLGNGVVPQQARVAVNQLMGRVGNVGSKQS